MQKHKRKAVTVMADTLNGKSAHNRIGNAPAHNYTVMYGASYYQLPVLGSCKNVIVKFLGAISIASKGI